MTLWHTGKGRKNEMQEPTKPCPCCGIGRIEDGEDTYDICPVCLWEDDGVQNDDPDFEGGANSDSLNQHRKKFKEIYKRPDFEEIKRKYL